MDLLRWVYGVKGIEFACGESPKVSQELVDALEVLKWKISPRQVVAASRVAFILAFIFTAFFGFLLFSANWVVFILVLLVAPFAVLHYVSEYPKMAGRRVILNAIGESPRTLVYLIVPLKQNPNLEEGFKFAAENSEGEVATDLRNAMWSSWSGKLSSVKSQLPVIAEKWGKFAPEFKHSLYLVASALSEKSAGSRAVTFDRALSYALEGIVSKMQEYVSQLFMPTLLIFSFGTIVPLMFVSLLPLLAFFGVSFSSPLEVAAILAMTLLVLFVYSEKVLLERPPSFSQPAVELGQNPANLTNLMFVILVALAIGFPGLLYLLAEAKVIFIPRDSLLGIVVYAANTLSILWGAAAGVALHYYLQSEPLKKLRKQQKKMESELVGVLHQLASRMGEKRPPEEAMEFVARSSPNSTLAQVLGNAASTVKKRAATLESALFDKQFGTARALPSRTVKSALQLFVVSCKKGSVSASQVLYSTSDYFLRLKKVEEELQAMLGKNISMLRATAIVFAPVVSAIVVVMFNLLSSSVSSAQQQLASYGYVGGPFSSALLIKVPAFSTPVLLLIVGFYMLGLCLVTMRYASFVENGPDEIEYKAATAQALPLSMLVFTIVLLFASSFLTFG